MGIHESELLDSRSVSDTLKCPVCFEVFDDPVFCGGRPCQHVFCRECIDQALERSEECPTCRAPMFHENLQPHQVIRSLLDEVPVRCDRRCGWTGRRDAQAAHAEVCPLVLMEQAQAKLENQRQRFANVDTQLSERDARIAELEALLADKDKQMVNTGQEMLALKVEINQLEHKLKCSEAQLKNARRQMAEYSTELYTIQHRNTNVADSTLETCDEAWSDPKGLAVLGHQSDEELFL